LGSKRSFGPTANPVVATRPLELAYFAGDAFRDDLAEACYRLGRFPAAPDRPATPKAAL
jgi:hypothetical protein